jgi:hypothetical protein
MMTVYFGTHLQNKTGVVVTPKTIRTPHKTYVGERVFFGVKDFSKPLEAERQIRFVWGVFPQTDNSYLVELDSPLNLG